MATGSRSSVEFTHEDLPHFPDRGIRREIIDGDHYATLAPNTKHQAIVGNLFAALRNYLRSHPVGAVFMAPFDVVFTDLDVVKPDLLYISRERAWILTDQNVRGVPDLVVEILSPGTRKTDETIKRKLYERVGVPEYWIVDPELDVIKIYRRTGEDFARVAELSVEAGDALRTPVLPDFSVPLVEIFAPPLPAA